MKWPNTLTIVRHGESAYNIQKPLKEQDPEYQAFKKAYNRRNSEPRTARELAERTYASGKFLLNVGNQHTPLTETGKEQSFVTGSRLGEVIDLPDVILVSPYDRTLDTLEHMTQGWPELGKVKTVIDERIREQEHGLQEVYGDWRIFNVLHPEQERLRNLQGPYFYRYPQGENVPDVRERIRSVMTTVVRDYHEQNVLMVAHHLTKLAIIAHQQRWSPEEFIHTDEHDKPINCGVTNFRGDPNQGDDGRLLLDAYNLKLY